MIPGSISGQLLIEQEVNRLDTAGRSSLIYPIDEVAALSIGVELVESRLEQVFKPVYLNDLSIRECTTITALAASINLKPVPVLSAVDNQYREATDIPNLEVSINLKPVPILADKEATTIETLALVSYRLAGVALPLFKEDCTTVDSLVLTSYLLEIP